jgi:hypothetical protein
MRDNDKSGDYEVGYGRPPRKNQFEKGGRSANPKGRPRGSRQPNLTATLLELMTIKVQGKTLKVPFLEAWIQVIKEKAIRGDIKACQILILVARQLGLFKAPEFAEDFEFTIKIGDKPIKWAGPPEPSDSQERAED